MFNINGLITEARRLFLGGTQSRRRPFRKFVQIHREKL